MVGGLSRMARSPPIGSRDAPAVRRRASSPRRGDHIMGRRREGNTSAALPSACQLRSAVAGPASLRGCARTWPRTAPAARRPPRSGSAPAGLRGLASSRQVTSSSGVGRSDEIGSTWLSSLSTVTTLRMRSRPLELMVMRSPTATGLVTMAPASCTTCVSQNSSLPATTGSGFAGGGLAVEVGEGALEAALDHGVAVAERQGGAAETGGREAQDGDREVSLPNGALAHDSLRLAADSRPVRAPL